MKPENVFGIELHQYKNMFVEIKLGSLSFQNIFFIVLFLSWKLKHFDGNNIKKRKTEILMKFFMRKR